MGRGRAFHCAGQPTEDFNACWQGHGHADYQQEDEINNTDIGECQEDEKGGEKVGEDVTLLINVMTISLDKARG